VVVSSAVRKGIYEAHVADNGPAFPKANASASLSSSRVDPCRARSVQGLAISRQIVERLGGSLSFASSKAGSANFIVRLNQ
jgi:C4-dicarboxylate-specific signal transduction histidine kinase